MTDWSQNPTWFEFARTLNAFTAVSGRPAGSVRMSPDTADRMCMEPKILEFIGVAANVVGRREVLAGALRSFKIEPIIDARIESGRFIFL